MSAINRRKPFSYKQNKVQKLPKTSRTEIHPITRAFVVGAVLASRDGYASATALAARMPHTQPGLSALIRRVETKAREGNFDTRDPILYKNDLGRGRNALLTQEQKDAIIALTTSDQQHREQESWQAIAHGNFDAIVPKMSRSTFENVMYEAGYSRLKPGWKPTLTRAQERQRYAWALTHNPDRNEYGDGLGFDFRTVVFTDETPARVGEERGMMRTWAKAGEVYDDDVRKERNRKDCCLQFFGACRYDHKGRCHVYFRETEHEKNVADEALEKENAATRTSSNNAQATARKTLRHMSELDIDLRDNTRKLQHVKKDDYHRGIRSRGGIDGYRHREGALKKVVPWINSLKKRRIKCLLLEDGAPPHKSRIANDYLRVGMVEKMV